MKLDPGTLYASLIARTEYALNCGALQPIPTDYEFIEQDGIRFLVRVLSNLARKERAKRQQTKKKTTSAEAFNPFLPYEEDLFVADISDTHLCLLNKFNVVDYHLLMITRAFEAQDRELTRQDFEAMWTCLAGIDGLMFYNSGQTAGASQRHKHLQLVPLPLAPEGPMLPIENAIAATRFQDDIGTTSAFPFRHAIVKLDPAWVNSPSTAADATLERYWALLRAVGLKQDTAESGATSPGAYNLLATREWMAIVPRSQESFQSISINALGFAGALLVRDAQQLQLLKNNGPMTLLKHVALTD